MYYLFIAILLVTAYATEWMAPVTPVTTSELRAEASVFYARGMIVYHQAAQKFHHDNPAHTGIVAQGQLELPDGFEMGGFYEARIMSGGWVVTTAVALPLEIPQATLVRDVQSIKDGAAGSGIIRSGQLVSARFDPIVLPVALPEGSAAIATRGG